MWSSVGVKGFLDVEAPEDTGDGDEE